MQQVIVAYLLFAVFYLLIQWVFGKKWDKGLDVRVYCERDCAYRRGYAYSCGRGG